ncbi:MAG: NIPSNAP family protein [Chloroflexi bacterium]|nr:NIPSNAP family protein [Chloroflexota bacterium]
MIYEIRTYDLRPGSVAEVEKRFAESLPGRLNYSPLAGFWHSEIGPLNQIVHIWPYDDLNQRDGIRRQAASSAGWPPDIAEFVVNMQSEIFLPAPFMTSMGERNIGPLYEMRSYTYPLRAIPLVLEAWSKAIAEREKLSPLAGCWHSDIGGLNRFVHLWAYKSFEERGRVREETQKRGIWPPRAGVSPVRMENKLLLPASFSPMQ